MKKLFAVAIVLAFFALPVFATDARINGLGVPAWMVQSDDSLVRIFQGQVVNYKNVIGINSTTEINLDVFDIMIFGSDPLQIVSKAISYGGGYANLDLGGNVLGIFANPYNGVLKSNMHDLTGNLEETFLNASDNTINPGYVDVPHRTYGIIYGLGLDNMSIGFSVGLADKTGSFKTESTIDTANTMDYSTSVMSIEIGAGLSMPILDVGITFGLPMVDNKGKDIDGTLDAPYREETLKSKSGMEIGANARVNITPLVIGVSFAMNSLETEDIQLYDGNSDKDYEDSGIDTNERSLDKVNGMSVGGGVSAVFEVGNAKLYPGVAVNYSSKLGNSQYKQPNVSSDVWTEEEIGFNSLSIPIYLAAEGKISDALNIRAGISKKIINSLSITEERKISGGSKVDPQNKQTFNINKTDSVELTGGFSVNIGGATIDATLTGGINVQNVPALGDINIKFPGGLSSQISAKYAF